MSIVQQLRQNNPAMTSVRILLRLETSDADIAQALEQNPFVTDIVLDLGGVQQANWHSLLRVIATRANLERVELMEEVAPRRLLPGENTAPAAVVPAALVRSSLQAMQQNTAILSVKLAGLHLPTEISMFVNTASSITSFCLDTCDMEPAERDQGAGELAADMEPAERDHQGARELAAALHRNTNIKLLELFQLKGTYFLPILEGLRSNVSLKTFIFSPCGALSGWDATSSSLQHLLESTTSIQRFELREVNFMGEWLFHPIAQGIINSECVSELKFEWCQFRDESFAFFQSILQNKRNLTALCLHYCSFGGGQVYQDIISMISRPDSLLRCFEFQSRDSSLEGHFPRIQFKTLLQAIQKSKLERFKIGSIQTQQQLQMLTQSIPLMRIKELEVSFFWGEILRENANFKQHLLLAIKNNFSLRSVKARINLWRDTSDLFENTEDKERLAFYANRNESLDQWVAHPDTVQQQKVWPDALGLAQRAGPSALFQGLRSVLEHDYGSLPGKRKRKRPQYYTPT